MSNVDASKQPGEPEHVDFTAVGLVDVDGADGGPYAITVGLRGRR